LLQGPARLSGGRISSSFRAVFVLPLQLFSMLLFWAFVLWGLKLVAIGVVEFLCLDYLIDRDRMDHFQERSTT